MQFEAAPPADVNQTPPTRCPVGVTARACAVPFRPAPSGTHAEPFQRATWLAARAPIAVKSPAATRSPPGITARAFTGALAPPPSGDHAEPFHRATWLAASPPAV